MPSPVASQSRLAYLKLESLIVRLELAPDSMVTEKSLIALAELGRTPVREAIQKLEWQGLILVRPRAGLQIAPLDPAQPEMIFQARRQLEPLAARLMAERIDEDAREALIACARSMTECSVTGDRLGFLEADKLFDEITERTCPNPFIIQALSALQTHARRYWFHAADRAALDSSVDLHVRVIRALLRTDPEGAEAAMSDLVDGLARATAL